MSLLFYFILFFILPNLSISLYRYDLIRNATIESLFTIDGHSKYVQHCNQCLCEAFENSDKILLFTCTESSTINYTCQFYYSMPSYDEIIYRVNHTNIYLITNEPFKSKDDCCNTSLLEEQLKTANKSSKLYNNKLRTITFVENDRLVAVNDQTNTVVWFHRNNLTKISEKQLSNQPKSIGYANKMYYVAFGNEIQVYYENFTFNRALPKGPISDISIIYFLSVNQLLVGTVGKGAFIYERNDTNNFGIPKGITGTIGSGQVHGFYGTNETAFYIGWTDRLPLKLYIKQTDNTWKSSSSNDIKRSAGTRHLVIDICQRLWIVGENSKKISIQNQNGTVEREFDLPTPSNIFSLLVLDKENYTLITTHESSEGLFRMTPNLNCRRLFK